MLSDRITLAVAHYYMSGTEANYRFDYGKIDEIKLSYTSNFKSSATLLQFNDLFSLAEFIEKSTKPTKNQAQEEAECTNMGLYELKSFRIGSIFVNQNTKNTIPVCGWCVYEIGREDIFDPHIVVAIGLIQLWRKSAKHQGNSEFAWNLLNHFKQGIFAGKAVKD